MSLNATLGKLDEYAREKVDQGEGGSISEVVREVKRLSKRREELWQATVQARVEEGMASLRAGRIIHAAEVKAKVEAQIAEIERARGSV